MLFGHGVEKQMSEVRRLSYRDLRVRMIASKLEIDRTNGWLHPIRLNNLVNLNAACAMEKARREMRTKMYEVALKASSAD